MKRIIKIILLICLCIISFNFCLWIFVQFEYGGKHLTDKPVDTFSCGAIHFDSTYIKANIQGLYFSVPKPDSSFSNKLGCGFEYSGKRHIWLLSNSESNRFFVDSKEVRGFRIRMAGYREQPDDNDFLFLSWLYRLNKHDIGLFGLPWRNAAKLFELKRKNIWLSSYVNHVYIMSSSNSSAIIEDHDDYYNCVVFPSNSQLAIRMVVSHGIFGSICEMLSSVAIDKSTPTSG